MQLLFTPKAPANVFTLQTASRRHDRLLFIIIFITALLSVPLFVLGGANVGYSTIIGGVLIAAGIVMIAIWPIVGFYIVAASIVLVEQEPLATPIWTDRLTIFYWPPRYAGLIERPIGFLILFVFLVLVFRHFATRKRPMQGGAMLIPFLLFLACVAMGVAHGVTSGGDFKITVVEVRPFWYMFLAYLLAYNLVTRKAHLRTLFWFVIIGAAIKGIQGTYIYFGPLHANLTGHREIMAHEESFFFAALLLLIILYCLHHNYRPQLYAALLATPCILIAMVANQRRTDYIALLVGAGIAWTLIFVCKPKARVKLVVLLLITAALMGAYVAAFYRSSGSFGAPARAIVSVFYPTAEDASSNAYRQIENYDLKYTVKQNLPFGMGFGKPFLQPVALPNILIDDPYYLYVPHNTIYWVWMRMGPLGYLMLWYLFGAMVVRGVIIVRQLKDQYLQLVSIYIVAIIFMEVVVAYADYQLFFYRNVIYLGILVGILMKLPSLDGQPEKTPVVSLQKPSGSSTKREIADAPVNPGPQPATSSGRR